MKRALKKPLISAACVVAGLALSTSIALGESQQGPEPSVDDALVPQVVGGQPAPQGKWPDVAAVIAQGQAICTGTLVAPRVVITAGHCVDGPRISQVRLNAIDSSSAGELIDVTQAIAHPNWESTYDIAVLILERDAAVAPRPVASDCMVGTTLTNGAMVHLVGFGATTQQGMDYNTRLMEGQAQVEDASCTGGNGCLGAVSPGGEFVAGGAVDSCYGDSGGPVYLDSPYGTVLAGVVSRGIDNTPNPCGDGGIYVRPDAVIDWIERTSGSAISKADCSGTPPDDDEGGGDDVGEGDDDGQGDGDNGDSDDSDPTMSGASGGCSAGNSSGSLPALALILCALILPRRRRTQR